MPESQDTDDNVDPVGDLAPRPAGIHVNIAERTEPVIVGPIAVEPRSIWPLEPWRLILVLLAITIAAFCGPAAAAPIWNGADLGVLISLAIFVTAFARRRNS